MRVVRAASAGFSSVRTASSTAAMWSMALVPRKGMLPWAMRPRVIDLEPVDPAVADADPVDAEGLGDDHVVGAAAGDEPALAEPGHAGEAAALLVHRAADLERPR